jgi:selenocysteine lyase/cysteine desulfurase
MPTYVDYSFLEEISFDLIMFSRYSNTHSENNACAQQTTRFRESARALIKRAVNATDDDVLIFTGTGKISRYDLSRY